MKLTLPWLKEHLETDATVERICDTLTALGLEVESVTDPGAALAPFSVAYVREARQHPNADRLRLCTVETRDGVLEVVCGASNARTGMKGVFAPIGSVIPATGEVLKKAAIRGVASNGMLCSARELGLGLEHDGIIELPEDSEIGAPAATALGLEGPVIEVKLTPDRADCFGVNGIARDLAAAGLGRLHVRDFSAVPPQGTIGPAIRLDFPLGEEKACPLFIGRIIRGVRNGTSPAWLRNRLKVIGLRPISVLVDITNYVTFDLCRPLHVFDAAKLRGDLTLRFAQAGEQLQALDGRTYMLSPAMTVIADETEPVSLGGIMGGEVTGVTAGTTDVLLEVALFDPLRTAATGRKLGIESDARTRFERGLDPALVHSATEYATRLILQLCGGEAGPIVAAGHPPAGPEALRFRRSSVRRLAGIELEAHEVEAMLPHLGFLLEGGPEQYEVTPPTWRHDITTEACIVEELARLHGYDRIPAVSLRRDMAVNAGVLTAGQRRRGAVRRAVASQGLAEAVTWSFISPEHARLFGEGKPVMMQNPLNAELSVMRPSLLPNLVVAAKRNHDRKQEQGGLFEVGPRYTGSRPGEQATALAGLRYGAAGPRSWAEPARAVDALDAKADVLAALAAAGLRPEQVQSAPGGAPAWYHPGRSGRLVQGALTLASFGELHPELLRTFDIGFPVVGFELDLDPLPRPKARPSKARPALEALPFPPVDRDFAFIVDSETPAARLLDAIRGAERKLIREVRLFDVYEGKGVPEGKKSLATAVRLQASDRTLTEAEIEQVAGRIVAAAEKAIGAVLRG
jgi:phenylalanyl-tRNA synthetase beta chain